MRKPLFVIIVLLIAAPVFGAKLVSCPGADSGQTCTASMVSISGVTPTTIWTNQALTEIADPGSHGKSDYVASYGSDLDPALEYRVFCNCSVTGSWMYAWEPFETRVDVSSSAIKVKTDYLPSATAGSAGGVFIAGTNAATTITTGLTTNITGNLSGSVGSVTGNVGGNVAGSVGSVVAGVTVTTNNDKGGYSLAVTPPTAIEIRQEMDSNSTDLDTLLARLTAIRAGYLDKLNVSGTLAHSDAAATYRADVSSLALEATLTAIKGVGWTNETLKAVKDALATAQADLDNPSQYKADVSGLASQISVNAIPTNPLLANDVRLPATLIASSAEVAKPGDSMALTPAAVDAVLDEVVEGGYTMRQLLRLVSSALFGKLSGGGTATVVFRDLGDTKPRITATVAAGGNRTSVILDGN